MIDMESGYEHSLNSGDIEVWRILAQWACYFTEDDRIGAELSEYASQQRERIVRTLQDIIGEIDENIDKFLGEYQAEIEKIGETRSREAMGPLLQGGTNRSLPVLLRTRDSLRGLSASLETDHPSEISPFGIRDSFEMPYDVFAEAEVVEQQHASNNDLP